jgi:hypothetical protein
MERKYLLPGDYRQILKEANREKNPEIVAESIYSKFVLYGDLNPEFLLKIKTELETIKEETARRKPMPEGIWVHYTNYNFEKLEHGIKIFEEKFCKQAVKGKAGNFGKATAKKEISHFGYVLKCELLAKFGNDKRYLIDERSYRRLANEFKIDETEFYDQFIKFEDLDYDKLNPDTHHKTIRKHFDNLNLIMPDLKTKSTPAYNEAERRIELLKEK